MSLRGKTAEEVDTHTNAFKGDQRRKGSATPGSVWTVHVKMRFLQSYSEGKAYERFERIYFEFKKAFTYEFSSHKSKVGRYCIYFYLEKNVFFSSIPPHNHWTVIGPYLLRSAFLLEGLITRHVTHFYLHLRRFPEPPPLWLHLSTKVLIGALILDLWSSDKLLSIFSGLSSTGSCRLSPPPTSS